MSSPSLACQLKPATDRAERSLATTLATTRRSPRTGWSFVATIASLALSLAGTQAGFAAQATPPAAPTAKPDAPTAPAAPAKATRPQNSQMSNTRRDRQAPSTGTSAPANTATGTAPQKGAPNATVPPAQQAPAEAPVVRFDPDVLDFGEMTAGVAMTKTVKIYNISNEPVTITKAVPGCGCTIAKWPKDPIAPGAFGEAELTLKPPEKQGIDLHKKVTFQLDGHPPIIYDLKGHVAEYIKVAPEMIDAPAADAKGESAGTITLTSVDNTPFKIVGVNPAVVKDPGTEAKTEHKIEVDWKAWADGGKSPKIAFTTDHPKATTLMVIVKRPIDRTAQPPTPPPANVNKGPNMTPLIQAVRSGDATAVKMQLANGADCNATDAIGGGRTALHWAVKEAKKDIIPILLEGKCNIEAVDRVGKTALAVACEGRDLEVVKLLVEKGANVNTRDQIGGSPLLWASGLGSPEVVKYLISKGADVNVVDVNGLSPLLWAAGIGSPETVEALVKAGAKVDVADKITGDTALMRAARTGKQESVVLLLKAGAPVNARNTVGQTAFMLAAGSGSVDKAKAIKDGGADIAAKDVKGWNALDHARNRIDAERTKMVEFLVAFVPESGAAVPPQGTPDAKPAATAAGSAPAAPAAPNAPKGAVESGKP